MIDPKLHLFHINQSVIILDGQRRVLMGKRSMQEESSPGKWTIPGGKLDSTDPDAVTGLLREIREEVGIEVQNVRLFESHIVPRDGLNTIFYIFTADYLSGEAMPLEDTVEVRWFSKEDLPAPEECTRETHRLINLRWEEE